MGWQRIVFDNWMLRGQREKLGLSQEEVAEKAGIKLSQYQRYEDTEYGLANSSMRIVNAVFTVLELDPTTYANGDYVFEDLPEDDPLNELFKDENWREKIGKK